jgi:hypothetical protein
MEEGRNGEHYLDISLRKAAAAVNAKMGEETETRGGFTGSIKSARELAKCAPLQFCVEKILPNGGMLIVSGPAKSGKSLLTSDLIMLLAGAPGKFLGRFQVRTPGSVLYCQAEVSEGSLKYRLNTIGASRDIKWEDLPLFFYTGRFNLDSFENVSKLAQLIQQYKITYLVVDPLARFHYGNENHQNEMAKVLGNLERAGRDGGCLGTILVHHHGKPQQDDSREGVQLMRGASVIGDWGNAHVIMQKRFSDSTGRKYVRVSFELRDADEPSPFTVMLDKAKLRFVDFNAQEERLAIALDIAKSMDGENPEIVKRALQNKFDTTKAEADRIFMDTQAKLKFGGNAAEPSAEAHEAEPPPGPDGSGE